MFYKIKYLIHKRVQNKANKSIQIFYFDFSVLHPGNKKSNTNRTTVKWNTLSPDFHEQFVYMSSITELPKQSLHISVWDKVKGRNDEYMGKTIAYTRFNLFYYG